MPITSDRAKLMPILLKWTKGDADAAEFLVEIAALARLADDIVDVDENRQAKVSDLLFRALTLLPKNLFFREYADDLGPVLNEALVCWRLGDEYRKSPDEKKRLFGFVMRESTDRIAVAVAGLLGGHEHAMSVSRELYEICHAPYTETVAEWSAA